MLKVLITATYKTLADFPPLTFIQPPVQNNSIRAISYQDLDQAYIFSEIFRKKFKQQYEHEHIGSSFDDKFD